MRNDTPPPRVSRFGPFTLKTTAGSEVNVVEIATCETEGNGGTDTKL